jgi:hypothetical protein
MKKIFNGLVFLVLCLTLCTSLLLAQDEGQGVEWGLEFSACDVLAEPGLSVKPSCSWNILNSGFVLGLEEWIIPVIPKFGLGTMELYQEYGFGLGESNMSLSFGNNNLLTLQDSFAMDGYLYSALSFGYKEVDFLSVELDISYLSGSSFQAGLAGVLGLGYEFKVFKNGSCSAWVDFNIDMLKTPGLGDIEFEFSYTHAFGNKSISLKVEPTISPASDWSLSLEPSLGISYSF